ncbi:hypothetical protein RI367_007149 [Sorochytrium milnesiophthora]
MRNCLLTAPLAAWPPPLLLSLLLLLLLASTSVSTASLGFRVQDDENMASTLLPTLLITNADQLNGYVATKEFLSGFNPSPLPEELFREAAGERAEQSLYTVHCTVSDAESEQSLLIASLGCKVHQVDESRDKNHQLTHAAAKNISDTIELVQPRFVLYVPSMSKGAETVAQVYFGALEQTEQCERVVLWSRMAAGEVADLHALNWYKGVEDMAQKTLKRVEWTVLRLAFGIERFLDFAPILDDTSNLTLPIGAGRFAPVSLHDACVAAHKNFVGEGSSNHQVYTLTGPTLYSGQELAKTATTALGFRVGFDDVTPQQAKRLFNSLENFTPDNVHVLLDVFECIRRGTAGCNQVSPHGQQLLGDTKMKTMEWFWEAYREVFRPGGD